MSHGAIQTRPSTPALRRLEGSWLGWLVAHLTALLTAAAALGSWGIVDPWRWLPPALLVSAFELWLLRRGLPDNVGADHRLKPGLGIGTSVTLLRGLALAMIAGFVATPVTQGAAAWLPGLLYLVAAIGDRLDGALARATDHVTRLGTRLDIELDALGLVVAPLYGVVVARLPPWYLLLSGAYYLFAIGLEWRRRRRLPLFEDRLRPSAHSRVFAGFQMGLVALALLPLLPRDLTWLAATAFMIPVLVGFARDWGVVTGRLAPDSDRYRRWIGRGVGAVRGGLPVAARLGLVAAGLWLLVVGPPSSPLFWALGVPVCLGLVARLSSLAMLGWVAAAALEPVSWVIATALLVVVLLGSGRWSLWQPEESWLFLRHPKRRP